MGRNSGCHSNSMCLWSRGRVFLTLLAGAPQTQARGKPHTYICISCHLPKLLFVIVRSMFVS